MRPSKVAMYSVYAIKSPITGGSYIGQTKDFEGRLAGHNAGNVRSMRKFRPRELHVWQLVMSRKDAMYAEWRMKRPSGLREKWLKADRPRPSILANRS